jgi:exosortase family protein XrtM
MPTTDLTATRAPAPSSTVGFVLRMLLYYGLMHGAYFLVPNTALHHAIYPALFGAPAVYVINSISPAEQSYSRDNRISSRHAALEIVRGCDGSGVWFLITAAVLAFPAPWRMRALGILGGVLLVYLLNLARLSVLYFVVARAPDWFLPLHTYFIPTLLIVLVSLYYLAWVSRASVVRDA